MARNINPADQYSRGGKPIAFGKMFYFDTKTNKPKNTFASEDEDPKTKNTHPVILDGDGVIPNVFFSGIAKQILTDKDDVQIFNRDPVGSGTGISAFEVFSVGKTYSINNLVTTDNRFFKSIINNNIGFSPASDDGSHWQEIDFNDFYASGVTYKKLDSVISQVDGLTYISVVDANKDNEPSVGDGSNWVLDNPALGWVKGKTYFIGERATSLVDNRTYKAVISQSNNEPSVDDGTNWLPVEGKVTKPVNSSPADLATDVPRSPTLVSSAYAVTGSTAIHEYSDYNIYLGPGRTNLAYSSDITNNLISHTVTDRLEPATEYFFETLHKGTRTDLSEFSDLTSFTTTINFAEVYDNVLFNGTGAALSVITTVDLNSNSGTIWVINTAIVSSMRIVDTIRGVGNAITAGLGFVEVSEPDGITAFNFNGFDVGTDVNYNAINDSILTFSFKQQEGVLDIVSTTGTGINRTVSHSLNREVGLMLVLQFSGASPGLPAQFCWFKGMPGSQFLRFALQSDVSTDSTVWNSTIPTTTNFSLGTSLRTNGTGRNYVTYLFAHNPPAGIFCGSYVGTGTSNNEIVTGFPVTTVLSKSESTVRNWRFFDKNLGTSSHISLEALATQLVAGGPESFNSDGFTVGSTANDSGITYFFMALADPALF